MRVVTVVRIAFSVGRHSRAKPSEASKLNRIADDTVIVSLVVRMAPIIGICTLLRNVADVSRRETCLRGDAGPVRCPSPVCAAQ